MIELLAQYNVTPQDLMTDPAATLIKLRQIFEAEVTELKGDAEKQESVQGGWIKALGSVVATDETVQNLVNDFRDTVRAMYYALVDQNSDVTIPLVETIASLKTDAMDERDYWIQKVKREAAPKAKPADTEYDERREDVEKLGDLIRFSYTFVSSSVDRTDEKFAENFPTKPIIEKGVETGDFQPELSRLPQKRNAEGASGRNASHRFVRYTWNGEEVPNGTLLADVAHDYVSDGSKGVNVSGRNILERLKATEQELNSPDGWILEFPTGTLTGRDIRPEKDRKEDDTTDTHNESESE